MPRPTTRAEILDRLREKARKGEAIVGAGAGIGLTAKAVDAGGADLIIVYNSGRYRMNGLGSLAGLMPYGNANDIVLEMAHEVLPLVSSAGTLAGLCATDPSHHLPSLLSTLKSLGVCGVQNFPTVGLIDSNSSFRQNLEETGMGYEHEVGMVRLARSMDLLTTPYVFSVEDARRMVRAGADVLVAHMGLTSSGTIGAKTGKTLDECVKLIQEIRDAAVETKSKEPSEGGSEEDVLVLCHGGPIAMLEDAQYVLSRTNGVHGFYGASSMERLPVEKAVEENARRFKELKIGQ